MAKSKKKIIKRRPKPQGRISKKKEEQLLWQAILETIREDEGAKDNVELMKKYIKDAYKEAFQDDALKIKNEHTIQRAIWITVKAYYEALGIGTLRFRRDVLPAFDRCVKEFNHWANADIEYADIKLEEFASFISGEEITIGPGHQQMELPLGGTTKK